MIQLYQPTVAIDFIDLQDLIVSGWYDNALTTNKWLLFPTRPQEYWCSSSSRRLVVFKFQPSTFPNLFRITSPQSSPHLEDLVSTQKVSRHFLRHCLESSMQNIAQDFPNGSFDQIWFLVIKSNMPQSKSNLYLFGLS